MNVKKKVTNDTSRAVRVVQWRSKSNDDDVKWFVPRSTSPSGDEIVKSDWRLISLSQALKTTNECNENIDEGIRFKWLRSNANLFDKNPD